MQITVDMNRCESHGQCVFAAPEVFSFDDEDYLLYDAAPSDELRGKVEKAVVSCPARAITIGAHERGDRAAGDRRSLARGPAGLRAAEAVRPAFADRRVPTVDWQSWHDEYDLPGSPLARRLRVVQKQIRAVLDHSAPGPLKVISLCAGQGRDLLEVLAEHPRRGDVRARLVELDAGNTAFAEEAARAAGLDQVDVVTGDAALTDHYRGMVPADLVLVCGLFGNITDEDIERTVASCSQLCETGGTVIWTRDRSAPDRVPLICEWFEERGFDRQWVSEPDAGFGVGVHRFTGRPQPLTLGVHMFTFVGYDVLPHMST